MNDLQWVDALTLSELVKNKEITPLELIEETINRVEKINPMINAIITKLYDQAIDQVNQGNLSGPFAGVPFLMKDLESFADTRYTGGSRFLKDFISPVDSAYSKRIRAAGLVTIGKTNTCELGIQPITEPALFGPTRNPWNVDYTAGGSSGGSAAAVAAGIVPMAHASDGGGSIRIPASCCGLFGLKVSRGRNPKNPDTISIAVNHCISRSVRDSAALLDATHGSGLGDPYPAPTYTGRYLEEVGKDPGTLKVGYITTAFDGSAIHSDCSNAVLDALSLCETLGHDVEEVQLPINVEEFTNHFTTIWYQTVNLGVSSFSSLLGRKPEQDELEPLTWAIARSAERTTALEYLNALSYMQRIAGTLAQYFTKYDVILTSTLSKPPVQIGEIKFTGDLEAYSTIVNGWVPYTPVANATGIPAMSVPLYWNAEGLPIGVHFMASYGDEATLLRLAGQLEQARPWKDKYPVV